MSICVHVFLWTYVFNIWLFGKEFCCWKPVEKQPNSPAEQLNFCIFLSATCERSNFFSQSAELVIVHPSEYSHPTWEWMPHCGLGLHCPVTNDIDHFFHMIASQLCTFFGNITIQILYLSFKITFQSHKKKFITYSFILAIFTH